MSAHQSAVLQPVGPVQAAALSSACESGFAPSPLGRLSTGHLVLDLGVLPRALRSGSAAQIRVIADTFEPLGLTALAIAFVVVGALIRLGGLG